MITIDVQIHGYRKGHQLLGSSIVLSKDDQAAIDRLSDVAGPLRPKEQFSPYLTTYPLPSGSYYVVARTWQDLSVPRAGCVRTKSLLVKTQAWSDKSIIITLLQLINSDDLPIEEDAIRHELQEPHETQLQPVSNFNATELLEALFLEEPKPIVVFDAPNPEQIAIHLLTALWPNIRKRFSLSTFALSPRKIDGRDLDIVFAPPNAKARFMDWSGRRIDGRYSQVERHRWTKEIVERVFKKPVPKLLSDNKITMLGNRDTGNSAALRIVLMWNELLRKLDNDPASALNLLDIVNSGRVSNSEAMKQFEPKLIEAINNAGIVLSSNVAWDFVSSISKKLKGNDITLGNIALENLASHLAGKSGEDLINLLKQPDPDGVIEALLPSIATGLANNSKAMIKQTLKNIPSEVFARLIEKGSELAESVSRDDELIHKVGIVLTEVDELIAYNTGKTLLPFLVEDRQLPAALPIIRSLDLCEVIKEISWLRDVNGFQSELLIANLIDRARHVDGIQEVRDVLITSNSQFNTDKLLLLTVNPVKDDITWIINEKRLSNECSASLLTEVLRRADDEQFSTLLSDSEIGERILSRIQDDAKDLLIRAATKSYLPIDTHVRVITNVLPEVDASVKIDIAEYVISRLLQNRFDGDESNIISMLVTVLNGRLDCNNIIKEGLNRNISSDVASRNLIIFEQFESKIRNSIIQKINVVAVILLERRGMDLTEDAYDACARLMNDAKSISSNSFMDAAGILMPSLMRARNKPVSLMVAAIFPVVYRELAKSEAVPESLDSIFLFLDWDRCKAARKEITHAFVLSTWRPGDLALIACRCGDAEKIIKQLLKSYKGKEYLLKIAKDLGNCDAETRKVINPIIEDIIDNWN